MSIVVPHLGNDPSFESSLVSVLENRPRRCEVLVCHDGSYTDPFDLGDEVQFVTAQGNDLPRLVSTAAHAAQGRLLHVLCDGQQATEGWTDSAIDCFEDATVGSLAPSIADADGKRTRAIGWTQSASCLCAPVAAGKRSANRRDRAAVQGAYLTASFWRTDVVRSLDAVPTAGNPLVAAVAWAAATRSAGLRCHSDLDSRVIAGEAFASSTDLDAVTARHLQSIAVATGEQSAWQGGVMGLLTNLHRVGEWGSAWGRLSAAWADAAFQRKLRSELPHAAAAARMASESAARPATLKMPARPTVTSQVPLRRAA
ncbi:hypothetical protein [Roseimaritima ulvae]|uniref:hypothetical protein n=1 Tax=Roseimaritima ulvae TaxID=980254 RepID=UPI0011CD36BC|nr:hypothetical protein [Roseimaritima ulvae]